MYLILLFGPLEYYVKIATVVVKSCLLNWTFNIFLIFLLQWNEGNVDATGATKIFADEALKGFDKDRKTEKFQYNNNSSQELNAYKDGLIQGCNIVTFKTLLDVHDKAQKDNCFLKPKESETEEKVKRTKCNKP